MRRRIIAKTLGSEDEQTLRPSALCAVAAPPAVMTVYLHLSRLPPRYTTESDWLFLVASVAVGVAALLVALRQLRCSISTQPIAAIAYCLVAASGLVLYLFGYFCAAFNGCL